VITIIELNIIKNKMWNLEADDDADDVDDPFS